ncbi:MAG: thioredoxin family protein [Peptococcaceae bacterium]|nr:thioredoxin family protein [Peptococcaceae bacterium]
MEKLNDNSFEETIYDDGEPCLVMFSRKSCHVCQKVHPKIEELAEDSKYDGKFGFYEVDVEEERNLFARFSLKGVPQVLFFNDGEYVGKLAGDKEIEEYEDKIDEIIG